MNDSVAAGVVLAQPDYPYSKTTKAETLDIPIYGPSQGNRKFVHPQSVKMAKLPAMKDDQVIEKRMWVTCGDYIAVVTGTGKTVKQAVDRMYKVVEEIHVPNLMYRNDIGEKLEKELPELQKHGFCEGWSYA